MLHAGGGAELVLYACNAVDACTAALALQHAGCVSWVVCED